MRSAWWFHGTLSQISVPEGSNGAHLFFSPLLTRYLSIFENDFQKKTCFKECANLFSNSLDTVLFHVLTYFTLTLVSQPLVTVAIFSRAY